MFRDREDAALQLADRLRQRSFTNPVVLGIPRGGVIPAVILAEALNAEFDLLLTRKIRAPHHKEFAIGAVSEGGDVYLYRPDLVDDAYLVREKSFQISEIKRRRALISSVTAPVPLAGRSVIVTDDGVATGSTLIAGLASLEKVGAHEIIVAIPVTPPDTLDRIMDYCDEVYYLQSPDNFLAIGLYYDDFHAVSDDEMMRILNSFRSRMSGNGNSSDRAVSSTF